MRYLGAKKECECRAQGCHKERQRNLDLVNSIHSGTEGGNNSTAFVATSVPDGWGQIDEKVDTLFCTSAGSWQLSWLWGNQVTGSIRRRVDHEYIDVRRNLCPLVRQRKTGLCNQSPKETQSVQNNFLKNVLAFAQRHASPFCHAHYIVAFSCSACAIFAAALSSASRA